MDAFDAVCILMLRQAPYAVLLPLRAHRAAITKSATYSLPTPCRPPPGVPIPAQPADCHQLRGLPRHLSLSLEGGHGGGEAAAAQRVRTVLTPGRPDCVTMRQLASQQHVFLGHACLHSPSSLSQSGIYPFSWQITYLRSWHDMLDSGFILRVNARLTCTRDIPRLSADQAVRFWLTFLLPVCIAGSLPMPTSATAARPPSPSHVPWTTPPGWYPTSYPTRT